MRYFLLSVSILISGIAFSQNAMRSLEPESARVKFLENNVYANKSLVSASENTFHINCSFDVREGDMPTRISVFNEEVNYTKVIEGGANIVFELPEGTYDFVYECWRDNRVSLLSVSEDVSVSSDSDFVFSSEDALNKVEFTVVDENGDQFLPDVIDSSDNLLEQGNIDFCFIVRLLIHKDYGIVSSYSGDYKTRVSGAELDNPFDFLISDVSDEYILSQLRLTLRDGVYYVNKMETVGLTVDKITNNPDDFVFHQEKFNKINTDEEKEIMWSGCRNDILWAGIRSMGFVLNEKTDTNVVSMYLDNKESEDAKGLDLISYSMFADDCLITEYDLGFGFIYCDTTILNSYSAGNMVSSDGSVRYVNSGHAAYGNAGFQINENHEYVYLPGHDSFSFTADMLDESAMMMNSSPFVSLMSSITSDYFTLSPAYIGQFGEVMTQDDNVTMTIMHNDTDVTGDYTFATIGNFCEEWFQSGVEGGVFELRLSNDNVSINDEKLAHSESVFKFDMGKEDCYAPTLQMFQIRDADGNPTVFLEENKGKICIAAGDFNFKEYYFKCEPVELKLYYKPEEKTEWTELKAVEDPEKFRETNFGFFYESDLSEITEIGNNGWIDIRITCDDMAGNSMEQILCSALHIDRLSSIMTDDYDEAVVFRCDNNIIDFGGLEVAGCRIYDSLGNAVMSAGQGVDEISISLLPSGVYVLVCQDTEGRNYKFKFLK